MGINMASKETDQHAITFAYQQEMYAHSTEQTIVDSQTDDQQSIMTRRDTALIQESDIQQIERIATAFSHRMSTASGPTFSHIDDLTALANNDPSLDPKNAEFNVSKWLKSFLTILEVDGEFAPQKTGVLFKELKVSGSNEAIQIQKTVWDLFKEPFTAPTRLYRGKSPPKVILNKFNGLVEGGELLIVLGRPGSGCSTLLKSLCGEKQGLQFDNNSSITYKGIPQKKMLSEFKGEVQYNQEIDKHFPHLTVSQTLEFAAACRVPDGLLKLTSMKPDEFARYRAQVAMAVCGLSHTDKTKVGNDFVRGVSGGERKRVSIAEMLIAGSSICAWDNSTRGLDSASALKFIEALRLASDFGGMANCVAVYQASQAIYDLFDKATVLYDGRQIYFGPAHSAKAFFEKQGWYCPPRQTTGDFLTAVTNPLERQAREGMANKVPRTAADFERYWLESEEYAALQAQIAAHEQAHPFTKDGAEITQLREAKGYAQSKRVRPKSPYLISVGTQIRLTTRRAYQRIFNDLSATLSGPISNVFVALVVGSIYYGTPNDTSGLASKGSALFMAVLLNALSAIAEIANLFSKRPIIEKHVSYAFYHAFTEALAEMVAEFPIKLTTAVVFNVILYFLSGLRTEAGPFFLYFLITFLATYVMSSLFRAMGALTKTVSQAMALAGVLMLALVIYTGYTVAVPDMKPWFSWLRWINPIFYAFEILIANEFSGRQFPCANVVPSYDPPVGDSWICSAVGAVAGQEYVTGDAYIWKTYLYTYDHVWRNFGIMLAFLVAFTAAYILAAEYNTSMTVTSESLVFQRGHVPSHLLQTKEHHLNDEQTEVQVVGKVNSDEEMDTQNITSPNRDIFTFRNIAYDIEIKGQPRRLLDGVSGWVKPGSVTALMGVSGAGKTTLLDVLAKRVSIGVITGDTFVNGKPLDASFQRKTGYVQQQDLHLATSTVRESLRFSAMLRQPKHISKAEKFEYVESVIDMLNMRDFANAVVGIPGEGLNVEQRKLLTIGVELAAKPSLFIFLDEPTSGLDSQSSWAICTFLRKLAASGQAVLCTIHQPSAMLFQAFDRLLFLAKGGKTVYFGDIGESSHTLLDYFESNGARKCGDQENPAEYMLEIINNGSNADGKDWHSIWNSSPERQAVEDHIQQIHQEKSQESSTQSTDEDITSEFAASFTTQLQCVLVRVFQQYWRMPTYVGSKWALSVLTGLFIGFSGYLPDETMAGMQIVIFSTFMVSTIFTTLVNQIQPQFVTQRELYEVRERPSKAYSWKAFMIANIFVELPYGIVAGILLFASFYYPSAGIQSSERQGLVLLLIVQFILFASTLAHMTIAAVPDAQSASAIVVIIFMMSSTFCGVMQAPDNLPGFWIFMYRVSPMTYWIGGIVGTILHDRAITCSSSELSLFDPPQGQTCGQYLSTFLETAPGKLYNPDDTSSCGYCAMSNGDQFLEGVSISWDERYQNFGIMWSYIVFNIFLAVLLYYLFRVRSWKSGAKHT